MTDASPPSADPSHRIKGVSLTVAARSHAARAAVGLMGAALLSACASGPKVSSEVASSSYLARSSRHYTPPGPRSDPWGPYIREASARYDVPERWVREVMRQESGGRATATSGPGAMGLMQVMPATYEDLRSRYSELGEDPYDPHNNILAGTAYIREMFDLYGSPGFLAAYNAGPGRLDDYLLSNRVLPTETRRYVAAIAPRINGAEPARASPGAMYAAASLPGFPGSAGGGGTRTRWEPPAAVQLAAARPAAPGPYIKLSPQPVEVAEAPPPQGPFITLRPQAVQMAQAQPVTFPGTPITLSPQPAGRVAPLPVPVLAARPAPVQLAQVEPARPLVHLPVPPLQPVRAPAAARPAPFRGPIEVAEAPEAPRSRAAAAGQRELAQAELTPITPHGSRFSLVRPALAEPMVPRSPGGGGGWGVQVGAYASQSQAATATASAKGRARELASAKPSVTPVQQGRSTLYRARLNGLSHDAATQACERLARSRTSCMLVAPNA